MAHVTQFIRCPTPSILSFDHDQWIYTRLFILNKTYICLWGINVFLICQEKSRSGYLMNSSKAITLYNNLNGSRYGCVNKTEDVPYVIRY